MSPGRGGGGVAPAGRVDVSGDAEYRERLQRALGDGYELGELLGRGGFGAVYAARDVKLERDVAVKALRHDVFPTATLLERFQREARAVAKLSHPNVLSIHTVGEGEGVAYMVMPLVEGESLKEVMDRDGPLAVEEATRILADVAAGLEAAHKRGIVHRDVKPANVMLDGEEQRVLLMDFGIAKAARDGEAGVTGTGVVVGSPVYMSPEQAAGEPDVDGRSDIYSLGALGYEMLTGRLPYEARNLHELVYKQVTEKVADVAAVVPGVPERVAGAVMRCLASDREDRWQTAADFRRAMTPGGASADAVEEGARDQESWLSHRGPYVLLLAFAFFAIRTYEGWMRNIVIGPGAYSFWSGGDTLRLASFIVVVLLAAAGVDLLARVAVRAYRGRSWRQIARFVLGQPAWWQAWYPRSLRVPDSVWDRLPASMKLLRTLVWLELIVLPAGAVLLVFVVPTFQMLFAAAGREQPLSLRALVAVVQGAIGLLPLALGLLVWRLHAWQKEHDIPTPALLGSLFTLRGRDWQGSPVRAILRD